MSRTRTPAIAGQPVKLGQSDPGTGKSSRRAKPSQPLISPTDMVALGQQRVFDVVMGLKGVDLIHELDLDRFYTDLNQVIWETKEQPMAIHMYDLSGGNDLVQIAGGAVGADKTWIFHHHHAKPPAAAHEPIGTLRGAMAAANRLFANSLKKLGVPGEVIDTLDKWQSTMLAVNDAQRVLEQQREFSELNARILQLQMQQQTLAFARHGQAAGSAAAAPAGALVQRNPMEGLTAAALGQQLGISAVTVRKREDDGALFSVLPSGRTRGRLYPAFQGWPGIVGDPLRAVLAALRDAGAADGGTAYVFFAGVTDLLGGLTPVEALLGQLLTTRPLDFDVTTFLASAAPERLNAVIEAAKAHAGSTGV